MKMSSKLPVALAVMAAVTMIWSGQAMAGSTFSGQAGAAAIEAPMTRIGFRLDDASGQLMPRARVLLVSQCIGAEENCKGISTPCCAGLTCSAVSDDYSGEKDAWWCVGSTEAD